MAMKLNLFEMHTRDWVDARLDDYTQKFAKIGLELRWQRDPEGEVLLVSTNAIGVYDANGKQVYGGILGDPFDEFTFARLETFYEKALHPVNEEDFNYKLTNLIRRMPAIEYTFPRDARDVYKTSGKLPIVCRDGTTFTLTGTLSSLRALETRINRDEAVMILESYILRYDPTADIVIFDNHAVINGKVCALRPDVLREHYRDIYKAGNDLMYSILS